MGREDQIVLDRHNLKRLAAVLTHSFSTWEATNDTPLSDDTIMGWNAAIQSLERIAEHMPEIYGDRPFSITFPEEEEAHE